MRYFLILAICFMVGMLGLALNANANELGQPSFEFGNLTGWSLSQTGNGDADAIDSMGITPNVMPTDGNLMAFIVSSGSFVEGSPYTGGSFRDLATDQLINTGVAETNTTILSSNQIFDQVPSVLKYDISFLAPVVNGCDNYAAVILINNDGAGGFIQDARCYNITGVGFINTNSGAVPCTQVSDDNIPYTVNSYNFGGRSNFFSDSMPIAGGDDINLIQFVTGQINDGVCNQVEGEFNLSSDTGLLVDNLMILALNPLDPSQAGTQNTLSADGFTPNGDVTFIYSFNVNAQADVSTRVAPDDICQGLDTPLNDPRILATVQADGNGDASFSFNIPPIGAGATVHIQAVDITNCLGSNVNQETIDGPPGAQPPVLLALNPGTAGQQNTLSATDATPNSTVRFIWGFNQGNVTANNICPGFQSGIINPRTLPIVPSDGAGAASLNVNVPANLAGVSLVLQAVDITTCTGSNVNPETL